MYIEHVCVWHRLLHLLHLNMKAQQNCRGAAWKADLVSKFNIRHTKVVITNIIFSLKNSTLLEENKVQYILMFDQLCTTSKRDKLRQSSQNVLMIDELCLILIMISIIKLFISLFFLPYKKDWTNQPVWCPMCNTLILHLYSVKHVILKKCGMALTGKMFNWEFFHKFCFFWNLLHSVPE